MYQSKLSWAIKNLKIDNIDYSFESVSLAAITFGNAADISKIIKIEQRTTHNSLPPK